MNGSMSLARSCCGHSSECLRGRAGGRDVKSRRVVAVGAVSRERSKGCLLFAHTLLGEPLRAERATEYRQRMCRRLPSTSLLCTARRAAEPLHVRAYLLKSVKETRSSLCSWHAERKKVQHCVAPALSPGRALPPPRLHSAGSLPNSTTASLTVGSRKPKGGGA